MAVIENRTGAETQDRYLRGMSIFREICLITGKELNNAPTSPTLSCGSGVPTHTRPSGSLYLRTNGSLYVSSGGGSWDLSIPSTEDSFSMPVLGAWSTSGDGANTNGGGLVGYTAKLAEQASTYAAVYDAGNTEFNALNASSGGTDYTADYQLLSDTKNDGDFAAFGAVVKFPEVAFDMSATVQTYTGDAGIWEYSQGSDTWATLTVFDNTDATAQDGKRPFGRDGAVHFVPPADWAEDTVNGQTGYWIRWRLTTNANANVVGLTNSKEHELVTPSFGTYAPVNMDVARVQFANGNATNFSTQDVKALLWNYTTGEGEEITWTKSNRTFTAALAASLTVSLGDELGVVNTQGDGVAEPSNVQMQLIGSRV